MTRLIPAFLAASLAIFLIGCGGGSGGGSTTPPTPEQVVIPAASVAMAGTGKALTLSTPGVTVTSGQSGSLSVSVDDATGLAGATLSLQFDPTKIACTDATSPLSGMTVVVNPKPAPGHAIVVLAGTTSAPAGPQILATFVLRVSGAASTTPVTLSGTVFDGSGNEVASTAGLRPAGVLTVRTGTGLIGDLTGLGLPSVASATKIMDVVAGLTPPPTDGAVWQWDANQNGVVDAGDAVAILRCVAGLDPWPIRSAGAGRP